MTPSQPSQSASVPDLAGVLLEVNALRATRSLPPLKELPKGEPKKYQSCVLANALNDVCAVTVWPSKLRGTYFYDHVETGLPPVLNEFARAFDGGYYPELIG